MIQFINEAGNGNTKLKKRSWVIPDGVRSHLEKVLKSNDKDDLSGNPATRDAYEHLEFILDSDSISYHEMKRIKNWFSKHENSHKTKQFELYGGESMLNWVSNALDSAVKAVKTDKEFKEKLGINTRQKDERDRQTVVSQVDDKTPTYNPATLNKLNRQKELASIDEGKVIILNEEQINALKTAINSL